MARSSVKERLLESAVSTFRRHGVRAASVSQLATDASIPVGSVYNHFESKESLAIEVLRRYVSSVDMSSLHDSGDAISRLRSHVERQIARTESTGLECGCLLANFAGELGDDSFPSLRSEVQRSLSAWISAVEDVIEEGKSSGSITSKRSAGELAVWLVASLQGATTQAKVEGNRRALDVYLSVAFEDVLA